MKTTVNIISMLILFLFAFNVWPAQNAIIFNHDNVTIGRTSGTGELNAVSVKAKDANGITIKDSSGNTLITSKVAGLGNIQNIIAKDANGIILKDDSSVTSLIVKTNSVENVQALKAKDAGGVVLKDSSGATVLSAKSTAVESLQNVVLKTAKAIQLNDSDDSNYIQLKAPTSLVNSSTLTLPDGGGIAGQALVTDGSGTLDWKNAGEATNRVTFSDFENNATTGYAIYDDGDTNVPVDATGGSATAFSMSINSEYPLFGSKDLTLTKGASSAKGEGVSYALTIPSGEQASILRFCLNYKTSTNYQDGDLGAYLYDVVGAQVIYPANQDLPATSVPSQKCYEFQTNYDANDLIARTSYRLALHSKDSGTDTWTVNVDNVFFGSKPSVHGAFIGDWVSYTPTDTITGCTPTGIYQRVGDSANIKYRCVFTTGFSGTPTFSVPNGLTVDSNKLTITGDTAAQDNPLFTCSFGDTGTTTHFGTAVYNGTAFVIHYAYTSPLDIHGPISSGAPFNWASGDSINCESMNPIPITGWSSNLLLSEDAPNREVFTHIIPTNAQTISSSSPTKITFESPVKDKTGSFSLANNGVIVPETGDYDLAAMTYLTGITSTDNMQMDIWVNGSATATKYKIHGATTGSMDIEATRSLTKGDIITAYVASNGDTSYSVSNTPTRTFLTVAKRSSPQTVASSEKVIAVYADDSGQTLTIGSAPSWNTKIVDTHNAFSSSTFTCPRAGYLTISAKMLTSVIALTAQKYICLDLNKNGSAYSSGVRDEADAALSRRLSFGFEEKSIPVNKGDTFQLIIEENMTNAVISHNNVIYNLVSFELE